MSSVTVQKVTDSEKSALPVFENIGSLFEGIQQRAYNLFQAGGCICGHDLDDWLKAEHEILGWPAAELKENADAYEAQITLPGYDAKDVEVIATPSEIVVRVASEHEKGGEDGAVLWTEFGSNQVYRRIGTPSPIDTGKVTAKLEKGVLRITAAKAAAPAKPLALAAA
jgi:HSP20 family molecular chaperone IbpA